MIRTLLLVFAIFIAPNVFAAERPTIILFSDDSQSYRQPAEVFKHKHKRKILEYSLEGRLENVAAIMEQVMAQKPALIFALGAKAAWFAKTATKDHLDTQVLFAMVINWQHYDLLDGQPNMTGISAEISPGTQLFNLSLLSPQAKRVGVIFSEKFSRETISKAQQAARQLGLELVLEPVQQAEQFQTAWRKMSSSIDAYWVVSDPVIYTLKNVYWLNDRCLKERVLCLGQSDNIAKLGVLLSINPDIDHIGDQAASLAEQLLRQRHSKASGKIHDPIATNVTLNVRSARMMALQIPKQVFSLVNTVVGKP